MGDDLDGAVVFVLLLIVAIAMLRILGGW